jgi:hypothetical protein
MMKVVFVYWPIALITDSISAPTKLSTAEFVFGSCAYETGTIMHDIKTIAMHWRTIENNEAFLLRLFFI